MVFEVGATYHIYNRSNETLFYTRENYIYFLRKIKANIFPCADIISYCLMPNHFHLLVTIKPEGVVYNGQMQRLSFEIGNMISGYTKAIMLNEAKNDYLLSCFMYIHQNPYLAKLVGKIEDWEFSSFRDYLGLRNGKLPNIQLGLEMVRISQNEIYDLTYTLLQNKNDDDFI